MDIEQELLRQYRIDPDRLVQYGFLQDGDALVYRKALPQDNLEICLTYRDSHLSGRILDLAAQEEYTNFRVQGAAGYAAGVRQQFTDLLLEIRETCCQNLYFQGEQARRIHPYIFRTYGGTPDFLWPSIPSYGAYRLPSSKKWYAIIGSVPLCKVDAASSSREAVEVINVKADSAGIQDLLKQKGYYHAFHMNKKCWVSIILDGTLPDNEICRRIDHSYQSV